MRRNDAEQIGEMIRKFFRQNGLESPLNEYRLVQAWKEVVGPVITRYTSNLYIKNQILYVQIARIPGNDRTDYLFPGLHQAILVQRRLQSILTEEFPDHIPYLFRVVPSHASSPFRSCIAPSSTLNTLYSPSIFCMIWSK